MNQPWIYMYSPSRSPLPPPSPPNPSGSSQCTRPEHLSHASSLGVLMRWMKLEPIIPSEVSQKDNYLVLSPFVDVSPIPRLWFKEQNSLLSVSPGSKNIGNTYTCCLRLPGQSAAEGTGESQPRLFDAIRGKEQAVLWEAKSVKTLRMVCILIRFMCSCMLSLLLSS